MNWLNLNEEDEHQQLLDLCRYKTKENCASLSLWLMLTEKSAEVIGNVLSMPVLQRRADQIRQVAGNSLMRSA